MNNTTAHRYAHADYDRMVQETFKRIIELGVKKGGEYAGDDDRLANFRRNAERMGVPMELIWGVYAAKHWDAVMQFVQDTVKGKTRARMEPISGRVDDLIVYLLLFKAILDERETHWGPSSPVPTAPTIRAEEYPIPGYLPQWSEGDPLVQTSPFPDMDAATQPENAYDEPRITKRSYKVTGDDVGRALNKLFAQEFEPAFFDDTPFAERPQPGLDPTKDRL